MEITKDQQILLDSLVCERLSSSEKNQSSDLGVLKPLYDLCCKFMSQSTLTLSSDAERFWKNFNQEEV